MERVYNFAAGPAVLPLEVLNRIQKDLPVYRDARTGVSAGMSVLEMSHRSREFEEILGGAERLFRELLGISDDYHVLFMQGGATLQFSMVPLNLMRRSKKADYVVTGVFAKKAAGEAEKFGSVNIAASSEDRGFTRIPDLDAASFSPDADYVHITLNNTIYGTRFTVLPKTAASVPLAADMSSIILSEPVDVSRFGLIYAGAQKNIGPAGLCLAVVRKDLLSGFAPANVPVMLDYRTYADNASLYNTPPTFSIYVAKLMFEWLKSQGGVAAIEKLNREKAAILYGFLDDSSLFKSVADREFRSFTNVTFTLPGEDLTAEFLSGAAAAGLVNLKGHRAVGGIRANLYNAMPVEGAAALADFMKRFEAAHSRKCR
ncbi:MAG: 3-phosphoserine/phosphohydroxythreonine transaminase [Synergistaceae bacterium]|jgi:phosphoserine aminotransferase|nr:3-phosphoserine/phosphohydroxythreonine transaminase [Synergistaceae bacterium]